MGMAQRLLENTSQISEANIKYVSRQCGVTQYCQSSKETGTPWQGVRQKDKSYPKSVALHLFLAPYLQFQTVLLFLRNLILQRLLLLQQVLQ